MTAAPYTEEQARDVWCPYVRAANTDGNTGTNANWHRTVDQGNCCIASRCAAWRWFDAPTPKVGEWNGLQWNGSANRRGYCGPCGKPEFEE